MSYSRVACDVITHSQWRHGLSTVSGGWLPVYESVARIHTIYLRIHETSPTHKPQNSWSATFVFRPTCLQLHCFILVKTSRYYQNIISPDMFLEIKVYFLKVSILVKWTGVYYKYPTKGWSLYPTNQMKLRTFRDYKKLVLSIQPRF